MKKHVYKICSISEWLKFKKKKKFYGSKKDLLDGYIHLSKKDQIKKTLKKYFLNKHNLILLEFELSKLKDIKMEKSSNGKLYPHLYSFLKLKDVKNNYQIYLKNGSHFFYLKF